MSARLERAIAALTKNINEVLRQQNDVITSTLFAVQKQNKAIYERLEKIMAGLQDLNAIETQLGIDIDQQNQDIGKVGDAMKSNIAALNEAIGSLKQQNPNLDITVLNAVAKTMENNHNTLLQLATSATAATAAAQTTLSAQSQGLNTTDAGATTQAASANQTTPPTMTDPSTPASQPAPPSNFVVPNVGANPTTGETAPAPSVTNVPGAVTD